jgi:hypothetical protein
MKNKDVCSWFIKDYRRAGRMLGVFAEEDLHKKISTSGKVVSPCFLESFCEQKQPN